MKCIGWNDTSFCVFFKSRSHSYKWHYDYIFGVLKQIVCFAPFREKKQHIYTSHLPLPIAVIKIEVALFLKKKYFIGLALENKNVKAGRKKKRGSSRQRNDADKGRTRYDAFRAP